MKYFKISGASRLGMHILKSGNSEKSIEYLEAALLHRFDYGLFHTVMGLHYAKENFSRVIFLCNVIDENPLVAFTKASTLHAMGNLNEAANLFRYLLTIFPNDICQKVHLVSIRDNKSVYNPKDTNLIKAVKLNLLSIYYKLNDTNKFSEFEGEI